MCSYSLIKTHLLYCAWRLCQQPPCACLSLVGGQQQQQQQQPSFLGTMSAPSSSVCGFAPPLLSSINHTAAHYVALTLTVNALCEPSQMLRHRGNDSGDRSPKAN